MNWSELIRPAIQNLKAYESARSLYGNTDPARDLAFMDANEAADDGRLKWNRYPEPQPEKLIKRLAQLFAI